MSDPLTGLLQEASSLHHFVDLICRFSAEEESSQAYGAASQEFFSYVKDLGKNTKDFLQIVINKSGTRKRWIAQDRQKLFTIKRYWCELHAFVKLASEGHSLRVPAPLLDYAQYQLRKLPDLAGSQIVILVSSDLNYFQHQHTELRQLSDQLTQIIPAARPLPKQLGFIAIPYSQGSSVLSNTLIYHELGHFVYEELSKHHLLATAIEDVLKKGRLGQAISGLSVKDRNSTISWCRDRISSWAEETFCDLFAISIAGPAYAFASIELFGLLGVLDPDLSKTFDLSHPAHAFRFKEQLRRLKDNGWWNLISGLDIEHIGLIKNLSGIPEREYKLPSDMHVPGLIDAFLKIRLRIRRLVNQTVGNHDSGLSHFRKWDRYIQRSLENGVVPSTIVINGRERFPIPNAIINSTSCFLLASLNRLIKRVGNLNPDRIEDRSLMAAKVEMWAMKALEDYNLIKEMP
jgi:hypothetical protein